MTQTQTDNAEVKTKKTKKVNSPDVKSPRLSAQTKANAHFIKVFDKQIANKLASMSNKPFMKETLNGQTVYVFENSEEMQTAMEVFDKQYVNKPITVYGNTLTF